jgi:hypothetical protein
MALIWGRDQGKYFLQRDWTTQISLKRLRKSVFRRSAFLARVFGPIPIEFLSAGSIQSRGHSLSRSFTPAFLLNHQRQFDYIDHVDLVASALAHPFDRRFGQSRYSGVSQ